MLRAARHPSDRSPRAGWLWLLACLVALAMAPLRGDGAELAGFELERTDDGLLLGYSVNFELSRPAEEALAKAVPLTFVAEVEVFRQRWYWRDKRVAHATRVWRVVYLPLTGTWRVTFGDLSQTYPTQTEALAAMRRAVGWKIADAAALEDDARHYVEFSFRLDTRQLPRPMQIGLAGQPEWTLVIERTQAVP